MNLLTEFPFYSKNAIREFFSNSSGAIKKSWGQNFLINPGILEKLVEYLAAPPKSHVLEIGCGLGSLTRLLLLKDLQVTGIEIDPITSSFLKEGFKETRNLMILNMDALHLLDHKINKEGQYLNKKTGQITQIPNHEYQYICGNLPFYISSALLQKIVLMPNIKHGSFILQKEYVDKIAQTDSASSLGIYLKNFGTWKSKQKIRKENFYPQPGVESAILAFEANASGPVCNPSVLEKLLRISFVSRRKKIQNSWKQDKRNFFPFELLMEKAHALQIDTQHRAEQIPLEKYYMLANLMKDAAL